MKYIIDFVDTTDATSIQEWMSQQGITKYTTLNAIKGVYIVDSDVEPVATEIVESITKDENVSVQLMNTVEIIPASAGEVSTFDHDADWWKTASAYEVDFDAESSTFERRGTKTNVYIVDSGIKSDHPEFEGAKLQELFSFNDDFADTNGHGTALASLVCGKTLGITDATVKSVKVFDSTKTTMTSDLVRAFDAIVADIIANPDTVAVVNMSWSIPKNEYLESKINAIIDANAFVVVSAGNSGTPIQDVTPASMERVLTIGAYTPDFKPANFSNYTGAVKTTEGDTNYGALDAWAPGVDISVALLDGTIGVSGGTSIAAAITTACLAYNSDSLYTNEGVTASVDFFLRDYSLSKKNLLILEDQYVDSINVIVTFITTTTYTWRNYTYNVMRLAYDNQDMMGFLAPGAYVSKIEFDNPLPEGLSLSRGWIVGRLVKAPEDNEIHVYNVTITYHTGEVSACRLTLVLIKAGTPPGDVPLEIQRDVPQGCGASANGSYCANYICESGCPNCDPKIGDCPCNQQCY
jgi:hypothetical protein